MTLETNIQIRNTPALVEVNFEALKERLEAELAHYEIVVTADTVADAKKLATELNATKKVIDDRRKAEVAKASEPIRKFDEQMKDLVIMCAAGRQKILDQVSRFEDEVRDLCGGLLVDARLALWQKHGVDVEFQSAQISDLKKTSNVTAKGNLTKAAKDEVEKRVLADKALQELTDRRLMELENRSYKAGLKAPLTRTHVESFLYESNEIYTERLDRLIAIEIERQDQAEARLRKDLDKEQAREQAKQAPSPQQAGQSAPSPQPAKGKIAYNVTCTFHVEVPPSITEHAVDTELRRMMKRAGFTSLTGVYVQRAQGAA